MSRQKKLIWVTISCLRTVDDELYASGLRQELVNLLDSSSLSNDFEVAVTVFHWGLSSAATRKVNVATTPDLHIFVNLVRSDVGVCYAYPKLVQDFVNSFQNALGLSADEQKLLHVAHNLLNEDAYFIISNVASGSCSVEGVAALYKSANIALPAHTLLKRFVDKNRRLRLRNTTCCPLLHSGDIFDWVQQRIQVFKCRLLLAQLNDIQDTYRGVKTAEMHPSTRTGVIRKLTAKLQQAPSETGDEGVCTPVFLVGEHGEGKSCVLAAVAHHFSSLPDSSVLYHSPNSDYQSSHVHVFLLRLLSLFLSQSRWKTVQNSLHPNRAHVGPSTPDFHAWFNSSLLQLNTPVERLADAVAFFLENGCAPLSSEQPCHTYYIILSSCDQLTGDSYASQMLSWLPNKLHTSMRVLLSCTMSCAPMKNVKNRYGCQPDWVYSEFLTPLSEAERRHIITSAISSWEQRYSNQQNTSNNFQSVAPAELARLTRLSDFVMYLQLVLRNMPKLRRKERLLYVTSLPESLTDLCEFIISHTVDNCLEKNMVKALLCLVATSNCGLYEHEVRTIFLSGSLQPPDPYSEKDEDEALEKECKPSSPPPSKSQVAVFELQWQSVMRRLNPFLVVSNGSPGSRWLQFSHVLYRSAVRSLYLTDSTTSEDNNQTFWISKLADLFDSSSDFQRSIEEFPTHALNIGALGRLEMFLCRWEVIDALFSELELSAELLKLWRSACQSESYDEMVSHYTSLLETELTVKGPSSACLKRYVQLSRIFLQAGRHDNALDLAKQAYKLSKTCEQTDWDWFTADLWALMFDIYDDKLKLFDFVTADQKPDLTKAITFAEASIALRSTLDTDYHQRKLGVIMMRLGFALDSWQACGGDNNLQVHDAVTKAYKYVQASSDIFLRLGDRMYTSEAQMTLGVLADRGSDKQLQYYLSALRTASLLFGEQHRLIGRLYINIGIVHEDNDCFLKAYTYFKKWSEMVELIHGPEHPKTKRALNVMKEHRYLRAAFYLRNLNASEITRENELEFRQQESGQYAGISLLGDSLDADFEGYVSDEENSEETVDEVVSDMLQSLSLSKDVALVPESESAL